MTTMQRFLIHSAALATFGSAALMALAEAEPNRAIGPSTIDRGVQESQWGAKRVLESPNARRIEAAEDFWPHGKAMPKVAIVEALISPKGVPQEVRLKESCGVKDWDDAALKTMQKWRFCALIDDGKPIEFVARQGIYLGRY